MVGTTPSWELLKITIADASRERVKAVSDRGITGISGLKEVVI